MKREDIVTPRKRHFLPVEFKVTDWHGLKVHFESLLSAEINSLGDLKRWLRDKSELESVISEDVGRRYIKMTCYTDNQEFRDSFNDYVENIEPNIAPMSNELNKKLLACPYINDLTDVADKILLEKIKVDAEIFREENIPLVTQLQSKQQEYGMICGAMTVNDGEKDYTLQQAGVKLQDPDRAVREKFYRLINERRIVDKERLDALYGELIKLRHQMALNAGFGNYRDYMFTAMHRFDYTPKDCFDFHEAIKKQIVPILEKFAIKRKKQLGLDVLRPWDLAVDPTGLPPLKPFSDGTDLLDKTIRCFERMDPFLALCLNVMKDLEHLDLVSRKGKAPGGYNYPLDEIGVPFIFMNAAGTLQDVITMLHEGGHAVHSIVTKPLALSDYRNLTSEIAELASMSMELISMDNWDVFFGNLDDQKRAKVQHLEHALETLPWVATIDKFQHWVYENPNHSMEERTRVWNEIHSEFGLKTIDWSGIHDFKDNIWQKQLHLFEVPFYYIEYGIAQLGAFGVWKNCKENFGKGVSQYLDALKLGYSAPIGDVYSKAGVKFDFTEGHIRDLAAFVSRELESLEK